MLFEDIDGRATYKETSCLDCDLIKQAKWYARCDQCRSRSNHFGRYKLLLASMQFLDLIEPQATVLYVGSAPLIYGDILEQLYPSMHFILFDPNMHKFSSSSIAYPSCIFNLDLSKVFNIFTAYFDDEACRQVLDVFGLNSIYLMSDIRRCGDHEPTDSVVLNDLRLQQGWVDILRPKMFWLKFRCLFDDRQPMIYLDGRLYLQAFTPDSSTECRLVGDCIGADLKCKAYDPVEHEERMCYFNTHLRPNVDLLIEQNILVKHFKLLSEAKRWCKDVRARLGVRISLKR